MIVAIRQDWQALLQTCEQVISSSEPTVPETQKALALQAMDEALKRYEHSCEQAHAALTLREMEADRSVRRAYPGETGPCIRPACAAFLRDAEMSAHGTQERSGTAMASSACLSEEQATKREVQRLPMIHELFTEGNLRREALAKQTAVSRGSESLPQHSHTSTAAMYDEHAWECTSCGYLLLTAHQLDLHVQEVHDSFFQAQAARSMKVFRCLVEGCDKRFTTPVERKQHLADFHRFSRGYHYETLHLGKLQAHGRPLQSQGHDASHAPVSQAKSRPSPRVQGLGNDRTGVLGQPAMDGTDEDHALGVPSASKVLDSMDVDSLATGLSKLSSCDSVVPDAAAFGRRNRRRGFS